MLTVDEVRGYAWGKLRLAAARRGVRVLNYHGVVEAFRDPRLERNFHRLADFQSHIAFVRKRRVLSMPELADALRRPGAYLPDSVVITFDDGYRNNLLAAEVLREARLPWTVFVTTGAVESGGSIWTAELSLLLLHGAAGQIEIFDRRWSLADSPSRESSFQAIRTTLKAMPADERRAACAVIAAQFPDDERERLLAEYPSLKMMSWTEIDQLDGAEIGSHGVRHEIHHEAQPAYVRADEMRESKKALENVLGRSCRFFAFPNGDTMSASAEELDSAGYELGFSTAQGCIQQRAGRIIFPRCSCPRRLEMFVRHYYWGA